MKLKQSVLLVAGMSLWLAMPLANADGGVASYYYGSAPVYQVVSDYGHSEGHGYGYGHKHRHHHEHCEDEGRVVSYLYEPVVRHEVVYYQQAPQYERHEYRQEPTYYESAPTVQHHSATPMIIGGIVGGVLGNKVGKGQGKDIATVAGVLLGGSIGRDMGYHY